MRRRAPLAVGVALIPVIGAPPRGRAAHRRAGVALLWRKPASAGAIPQINLMIRPTFRFNLDLGILHRELREQLATPSRRPDAAPRSRRAAAIRVIGLRWGGVPQEEPRLSLPAMIFRDTPARFVTTAAQPRRGAPLIQHATEMPRRRRAALTLPTLRREPSRRLAEVLAGDATAAAPAPSWRSSGTPRSRAVATEPATAPSQPGGTRVKLTPATRPPCPRTRMEEGRTPVRSRAETLFARVERHNLRPATIVARSVATRATANPPSSPARARRAALDLAWQPRVEPQVGTQQLAALARSLSSSGFTQTVMASRPISGASHSPPPATLPDAGRLVDEVIDRIERRMRSDRLRRGL